MSDATTPISVADIRRTFVGTCPPDDPTRAVMPAESARWPAKFLERASHGLTAAGVLVPLIGRQDGIMLLLTQRSSELRLHAGQVSFPGGRMEKSDGDIVATALREAHEEVGIHPESVDVVGYLDPSPTVTGYAVTPVIGLVDPSVPVVIDPGEVEAAFEVPLDFLMDESSQRHTTRDFEGVSLRIVEFNYAGHRIWGATASMIIQVRNHLIKQ